MEKMSKNCNAKTFLHYLASFQDKLYESRTLGFIVGGPKRNRNHYIKMSIIEGIEFRLSPPQQNLKSEMLLSLTYIDLNQLTSIINHLSLFAVIACSTLRPLSQ